MKPIAPSVPQPAGELAHPLPPPDYHQYKYQFNSIKGPYRFAEILLSIDARRRCLDAGDGLRGAASGLTSLLTHPSEAAGPDPL